MGFLELFSLPAAAENDAMRAVKFWAGQLNS